LPCKGETTVIIISFNIHVEEHFHCHSYKMTTFIMPTGTAFGTPGGGVFGAATPTATPGGGLFGQQSTSTGGGGLFGSAQPQQTGFGQSAGFSMC
jgi:hypothetical protein